jgi:hypothetical protein
MGVLLVVEAVGSADDPLVLGQTRIPLAGAPAEEPVEVVEPPADGPAPKRSCRALLTVRRQMPFAERPRAVSVVPQDPGERDAVVRDERRIAREPGRELANRPEADRVAVTAREKRRTRRRAERRDVEAVVPQALLRDPRVVRSVDRPAEGRGVPEAGISSISTSRTFGAPSGASTPPIASQSGLEPSSVRLATSWNACLRIGSLLRSDWVIIGPPDRRAWQRFSPFRPRDKIPRLCGSRHHPMQVIRAAVERRFAIA